MKRILVLSWYSPGLSDSGERIRLRELLESLSVHHSVTLYQLSDDQLSSDLSYSQVRSKYRVRYFYRRIDWVKALIFGLSVHEIRFSKSRQLRKELLEFLRSNNFDVVIANQLPSYSLLQKTGGLSGSHLVLDTHNAEGLRIVRAINEQHPFIRLILKQQVKLTSKLEVDAVNFSDCVLAVSEQDKLYFDKLGSKLTLLTPNGSSNLFHINPYRASSRLKSVNLVYLGSLSYSANRHGILKFLREYASTNNHADWRLTIGGSGAPENFKKEIQEFANVNFIGYVDNTHEFLLSADAVLVPLWLGGGSRLKILEAFSIGMPVISTSIGIEGIKAQRREHFFDFDTSTEFWGIIRDILENPSILQKVSNSCFELSKNYSWREQFSVFLKHLDSV